MKKAVTYSFAAFFTALTIAYLIVCIGIATERRNAKPCPGVNVAIEDSAEINFITRSEVRKYLDSEYGKYVGEPIADIDLTAIERILEGKDAIYNSEAYISPDGMLNVTITQRKPVVGFRSGNLEYYADREGVIFPIRLGSKSEAVMISGSIPLTVEKGFKGELKDSTQRKWLMETIAMTEYIKKERLWKDVKYYVNKNGDFIISPEDEDIIFILGSPEDYERKIGRIRRYYLGVVPEKGADYYTSVNVKYAGQIVCRNDSLPKGASDTSGTGNTEKAANGNEKEINN